MVDNESRYIDITDKNSFAQAFWNNVELLKEWKHISLAEVARRGGLHYSTLASSYWNRAQSSPPLMVLLRLSAAFRIPPDLMLRKDLKDIGPQPDVRRSMPIYSIQQEEAKSFSQLLRAGSLVLDKKQMRSVLSHALSYVGLDEDDLKTDFTAGLVVDDGGKEDDDLDAQLKDASLKMAQKIFEEMERQGLTKNGLADKAGITNSAYRKLSNGSSTELRTVLKLAKALNIPYKTLFSIVEKSIKAKERKRIIIHLQTSMMMLEEDDYEMRIPSILPMLTPEQKGCLMEHLRLMLPTDTDAQRLESMMVPEH